jgi:hypothetical protein
VLSHILTRNNSQLLISRVTGHVVLAEFHLSDNGVNQDLPVKQRVYPRPMKMTVLLVAMLAGPISAQVVLRGPQNPTYCYEVEKIRPNLELRDQMHILGTIRDQTTAPFKGSRVELRNYVSQRKQVSVGVVTTDDDGHFDLGTVKPGKYRLLASPNRAFQQPSTLRCEKGPACDLKITLIVNATDQPESICPIR